MSPAHPGAAASPPPSGKLSFRLECVERGSVLHRIHDSRFDATAYNPGLGNSRFAPFKIAGHSIPTAYAATSLKCAAFETIFHDVEAAAAFKVVPLSELARLSYSSFELNRDLNLAAFYSADLMKFQLERHQLIDTPASSYGITQLWSPAVYLSDLKAEGMVWVSRRYDQERALMLFGDRVTSAAITPISSVRITKDARTLEIVFELGQRAGIDIVG